MPDLIRHPGQFILDSGFRRNDDFDIYCCRSNNHRTSAETVYDDAVVEALNQGHAIEKALAIGGE
jgi:hypothetical protein